MSRTKPGPIPCTIIDEVGGFSVELPRFLIRNLANPEQKPCLARRYANRLIGFREHFPREICLELLYPYTSDEIWTWTTHQLQTLILQLLAGNAGSRSVPKTDIPGVYGESFTRNLRTKNSRFYRSGDYEFAGLVPDNRYPS